MIPENKAEIWIDAAEHNEVKLTDIQRLPVKHYFAERKTYGTIIKEDEDGIIILRDITVDNDCEILAIPKAILKRAR